MAESFAHQPERKAVTQRLAPRPKLKDCFLFVPRLSMDTLIERLDLTHGFANPGWKYPEEPGTIREVSSN